MTMDMTMDARSRKALEGLKSLDPLSNTCWRMMNGFAPEIRMAKLEGISQVLPYDYPLTVTTFWYWLSKATDFDAQQQFKRFLVETGVSIGYADHSPVDPMVLYKRPDSEKREALFPTCMIYNADGHFYDESLSFKGVAWGDVIDIHYGRIASVAPQVTGWLSDALWSMCDGDMSKLKGLLDERHGCVRLTELERSTTGLAFEDEWGRATWAAWQRWCSAQGLADPYIEIVGAL